ncbi:MAG: sensor histidine kinase [Sulfobacillus sp.]
MTRFSWGPLIGAVVGGLVGVAFGPVALAVGMLVGTAAPSIYLASEARRQAQAAWDQAQLGRRLRQMAGEQADPAAALDLLEAELADRRAQADAQASLLSQLDVGVLLVDLRRRITAITPRAAALLGVLPTAVVGLPLLAVSGMLPVEGALAVADGTERQLELEGADGGQLAVRVLSYGQGWALVIRDVTEIYHLQEAGQELVANLSHELRTPLTAIRGYLETALDDSLSTAQHQRFLQVAMREVERMAAMVDSMLDLSTLEARRRPPEFRAIDVDQLIAEIAESLLPVFSGRQITFICRPESGQTVYSDPSFLQEILLNCLDNAQKYTAPGGEVVLGALTDQGQVVLTVSDTGRGIPAEDLPHIFDRFYRVDRARSRASGGTGLGLAIAHRLSEAIGAHLVATSTPGVGTTFRLELPSAPKAAPEGGSASGFTEP